MSKIPIPFSEPPWLMGLPSAYYNESHRKWQKTCRSLVDELMADAQDWEREGDVPEDLYSKFAAANMLLPNLSAPLPIKWLKKLNITHLPGDLPVEQFDYLHTLIYADEMARSGSLGPSGAITTGIAFGLPPILKFGSQELQERFVPDIITGRKRSCIAITEPGYGSDVSNITTTAKRSEDGKFFIVNGTKKWITNGLWSDYASMAVRTGGPGPSGLSMLVVPLLNTPGVRMRRIKVGGQTSAGTTFIELDDVKVPISNLIGKEGMGMIYVMQNFNHERLSISIGVNRLSRVALSSAFEYVMKREAFGKTLMEQPVVRHRLAKCGAELEAHWAWIEQFTYMMTKLSEEEANRELGGLTALAKAQAGKVLEVCASTAVLLFGGNGYTKSGQGEIAERIYREVPGARIPGGSEDVMLDLAIRQLVKNFQRKTKELETIQERPKGSSKL
ncbi:Acyl-CoA dehydrogenase NM [Glarea lozoyensis ATCC 20868]|uniref:Acyl-CoA dehydrogenase NM n=1 Tax=Glarea lozoyensis (strain ATCC 20868 / MF5171) TaxID=1116229 RepID=S3D9Y2_GLAL2|nr:Acyl-CoA dehydrogenase NM [Glarea lozoyensis ATCC 20868]EPE34565.1 Acyl-CoA dehydrogenase NM [Glarea lozoyensis ATCC 20868]